MTRLIRRSLSIMILLALLLAASAVTAAPAIAREPTDTTVRGIDVDGTTIPQLQRLMDRDRLTSVQLTRFYLNRIRKLNPMLNAVITVSPRALADARAADRARRNGDDRPLLGMPIIVKDNINTTGMPTTAGSWALAGSSPMDAFIVKRLRAAGAIIIGKANLSEWANSRSIPSSSGWSGIGGQTNMPYVLDRNPCGSSSGSAVVAAADLAVAAVGTETDGSIVCPSGANAVVGIKPTLGLLSRTGIIPISADQDTAGPMTRNVTDAAVLLGAMTGVDPKDPATAAQRGNAFRNYTQFLDRNALRGARIGVWREGTDTFDGVPVDPDVDAIMDDVIDELEDQGATVSEVVLFRLTTRSGPSSKRCCASSRRTSAPICGPIYRSGIPEEPPRADQVQQCQSGPREARGTRRSSWMRRRRAVGRVRPARPLGQPRLRSCRAGLRSLLEDFDAIVAPTNGPAWVTDPVNGDLGGDFSTFIGSSSASAISGWADITVPAGYVDGALPIGVTFIGGRWDEPDLIGYAFDYERASRGQGAASVLPTLD